MVTAEENERWTRVGRGTPTGELLRRYWHPVAASSQLRQPGARAVRLLGEDLVLYRDRQDRLGLLQDRCPHRLARLVLGVPEEEGLRCAYHGWMFDAAGRCLEQPYETTEDPGSTFRERIRVQAYPVQELGGLIFAYLGPEPVPLLPRWVLLVADGVMRDVGIMRLPCNWLQAIENALDPVHVQWLHMYFHNYVIEKLGRSDVKTYESFVEGRTYEKIKFDIFDYGIIKRRVVAGTTEEDPVFKEGRPIIFPTIGGQGRSFQYRVPMDDESTLFFYYYCRRPKAEGDVQDPRDAPAYEVPMPTFDEQGQPRWELLDCPSGQDTAAWWTQGRITDRSQEHLGRSDRGIILFRELLRQNLIRVEQGQDPMNVFRDPAQNVSIDLPGFRRPSVRRTPSDRQAGGGASKYSPLVQDVAAAGR